MPLQLPSSESSGLEFSRLSKPQRDSSYVNDLEDPAEVECDDDEANLIPTPTSGRSTSPQLANPLKKRECRNYIFIAATVFIFTFFLSAFLDRTYIHPWS